MFRQLEECTRQVRESGDTAPHHVHVSIIDHLLITDPGVAVSDGVTTESPPPPAPTAAPGVAAGCGKKFFFLILLFSSEGARTTDVRFI